MASSWPIAYQRIDQIPFDTDRKRMSVLRAGPQGRVLYCKGVPEAVLSACDFVQLDAGAVSIDAAVKSRILAAPLLATAARR